MVPQVGFPRPAAAFRLDRREANDWPPIYETVTERQCMLALQATNDALALCSQATGNLGPYLGPQCYPQVRDDARYRANEPKQTSGTDEVPTVPAARERFRCWLQCDDCNR